MEKQKTAAIEKKIPARIESLVGIPRRSSETAAAVIDSSLIRRTTMSFPHPSGEMRRVITSLPSARAGDNR
jgi:hypothetical protein